MNTKAVFHSDAKMYKELREACHEGLARIEISYYMADYQQEQELLSCTDGERFEVDLDLVLAALCRVEGICYALPMTSFFNHF